MLSLEIKRKKKLVKIFPSPDPKFQIFKIDFRKIHMTQFLQSNVVRLCPISGHSFGKKISISTKISIETMFMGPN